MGFVAGLDIAWFPFGGWELDQRNRSKNLHIFWYICNLGQNAATNYLHIQRKETVFFVPAVMFGHNWKGNSRTWGYGEENYSSSKACLFLQSVIKSSNDNNRCPKARIYFWVMSSHAGLITGTEPNYPLGCMLVFFYKWVEAVGVRLSRM